MNSPTNGKDFTKDNEGLTLVAKKDSIGWEIGYGHNAPDVVEGLVWTIDEAELQFEYDYGCAQKGAQSALAQVWDSMNDARQGAFTDMVYELGLHGFESFDNTISFALAQNWEDCAHEIANSKYAFEVPTRATKVCALVRTGSWDAIAS